MAARTARTSISFDFFDSEKVHWHMTPLTDQPCGVLCRMVTETDCEAAATQKIEGKSEDR